MVAVPRLTRSSAKAAPIGAFSAGAVVAAAFLLMPSALLESLAWNSGIAALLPAAAQPFGLTARVVLALVAGGLAAAVTWAGLYLMVGPGGFLIRPIRSDGDVPVVRRADAHPDAPPRRPMSAADLGTPLMEVGRTERPIPVDLDQPLAAFDPAAILATPHAPVRPVAPLTPPELPRVDRMETFALATPVRRDAPRPAPASPQTIESLLRRLEEGAARRAVAR